MCVIIVKKPGIIIPFEKIESACYVNNDGFGISILKPEAKELLNYKDYKVTGNKPQDVYDIIEQHKEETQFIHLRFTTKGEKNLSNCHPFPLIQENDYQLYLMHNGTLSFNKFDIPSGDSDTKAFCEQYAAPTAQAFYAVSGKDLMNNEAFLRMMDHFISASWYFLIYDNLGNYRVLGGTGHWYNSEGKEQHGDNADYHWWASNNYSFNRTHRMKSYSYTSHGSEDDCDDYGYYSQWAAGRTWDRESGKYVDAKKATSVIPFVPADQTATGTGNKEGSKSSTAQEDKPDKETSTEHTKKPLDEQVRTLGYALAEARRHHINWSAHTPPEERPTIVNLCNLNSLEEVNLLTEDDIWTLVEEFPDASVMLIMDLIYELYRKNVSARTRKENAA